MAFQEVPGFACSFSANAAVSGALACSSIWGARPSSPRRAVNPSVIYTSAYREMEEEDLKTVVGLMRSELSRHKAELSVVDGLVVENFDARPEESIRRFA